MSRNDPQVNFRMPAELKSRLEEAAAQNKRSTTAEIVARLEASFQKSFTFADAIAEDECHRTTPKFSEADVKAAIDQVFGKLLSEGAGLTATPKTKRPLSKQTRPLGMDQAEWEAKRREELTALDAGVTLDTDMEIPTTVKPERRIRRREEDKKP